MLDAVFLQILNMGFTASFVIVAVLLLRLLLKKAPRRFSYLLWAVVLLRLVCPFTLESAASLIRINPTPLPSDIVTTDTPRVETGLPAVDAAVNEVLAERYPETETITPTPAPDIPAVTPSVPADPVTDTTRNFLATPLQTAAWVWLVGIVAMVVYSVMSLLRLRRRLVGAMRLKDNLWLADRIDTPFVLGLFRPRIYLPSSVREEERGYILLHEQTHIRCGDHIVRLIAFAVLAVYWFHPLVWVAFVLSMRDMEMACDESVLKTLGPDIRAAYSQTLLSFATGRRIAATPLAFGEGDPKGRIHNILHYKKPTLWVIIVGVIACCVAAVCLLTTAAPEKQPAESGESGESSVESEVESDFSADQTLSDETTTTAVSTTTTQTTTTTKATTVTTVVSEKLKLTAKGALSLRSQTSETYTETLLTEEQAKEFVSLLNRQTVQSNAVKGNPEYIFTLNGQSFALSVKNDGWVNLLDKNGSFVHRSIRLSDADAKKVRKLLEDAEKVPVPRYPVTITGGSENVVLFSARKGETMELPEGYTYYTLWDVDTVLLLNENNERSILNLRTNTVVDYKADAKAAVEKAGLQKNGETIEIYPPFAGGMYCTVIRIGEDWREGYIYELETGVLRKLPYPPAIGLCQYAYKNNTYTVAHAYEEGEKRLYLMDLRANGKAPILLNSVVDHQGDIIIHGTVRESLGLYETDSEDIVIYYKQKNTGYIGSNGSNMNTRTEYTTYYYDIETGKTVSVKGYPCTGLIMNGRAAAVKAGEKDYRLYDVRTGADLTAQYFDQIPLHEDTYITESRDGVVVLRNRFNNKTTNVKICEWEGEMYSFMHGNLLYAYPKLSEHMYILNLVTNELTTVPMPDSFMEKSREFAAKGELHYRYDPLTDHKAVMDPSYIAFRVMRVD
ncbi:MAG: hypothetical protein J6K98_04810 [Clostridia bacterium]|nr:hypothetical protein [Clostridia bacterium]